ncbi:hypothetical protein C8D72_3435 [Kushneria indalinina DSM 14324]|uniref:Uncharacterized protein n=1 Tax=Kushneria indalinina DSM 14324 TaxID=1122140 RepID=A0A3D9DSK3_9GAMM|nr:hypothetical protein C8D72_3435 [Kushneria indalinina DSM 14324]
MSTPFFDPLEIAGQTYDLGHLDPFSIYIDSRKAGKVLNVRIRFTCHCFTMGYDTALHQTGHPILKDQGGRDRLFCSTRYRLSHGLPAIIAALSDGQTNVRQTSALRNWAHTVKIEDPQGPYYIFFELRRAAKRGQRVKQDLDLTIESAYHQDPEKEEPALRGKMRFDILCGKIYKGEPVATQTGGKR